LETGAADIVETVNGPQAKQLMHKPEYHVLKVLPFLLQVLNFNHAVPPCDDVNFRRAVAACLNVEETMAIAHPDIYELDGGWVFPNSPYYTKAGLDRYNQNDPSKAKAFLARSKYKGEKLTFIVDNNGSDTDAATDIAQQLGQIGIQIVLKVADWSTVSKIGLGPAGWHFWTHGFGIEPYEWPATVMSVWVNGLSQQKDDPVIDRLFAEFEAELDMARQTKTFAQFQQHMWDDAVALQIGDYGLFQVVSSKVANFVPYRIPRLWGVWLMG
jgi:peptide/nickel transport system substrate-binding protein